MAETARAPVPAPSGRARIAAPRRRRLEAGPNAGEEGREVGVDDALQLRLGGGEGAQELGQALTGGKGGDGERAEETAAVVEHELEVDGGGVDLAVRGRGVSDEAVHDVALVEEAGEARVLGEAGGEVGPGERAPDGVELAVEVAGAFHEDALDALQRVEEPAEDEERAVGGLKHGVAGGGDGQRGRRQGVGAGEARAADAAEGLEGGVRGAEAGEHARDVLTRAVGGQAQDGVAHDVEAEELAVALEEDRAGGAGTGVAPELAEEAEALAGGQDVVALEERDLDLAKGEILGGVGKDGGSGRQRHRPALREVAAGVGRAHDLDESVVAGHGCEKAAREGAVRERLGRVGRDLGEEVTQQKAEDLAAAGAGPADVVGEGVGGDVEARRGGEAPPAGKAAHPHLGVGSGEASSTATPSQRSAPSGCQHSATQRERLPPCTR